MLPHAYLRLASPTPAALVASRAQVVLLHQGLKLYAKRLPNKYQLQWRSVYEKGTKT